MSAISINDHLSPRVSEDWLARAVRTAGLGLALGLAVQLGVLATMAWQQQLPQPERLLADAAQAVVFATLAFTALTAALSIAKGRTGVALVAGLAGAFLAVLVARSAQAGALGLLIGGSVHGATPWLAAAIKGAQFAVLAALCVQLARRHANYATHALAGATLGVLTLLLPLGDGITLQKIVFELSQPTAFALALAFTHRK